MTAPLLQPSLHHGVSTPSLLALLFQSLILLWFKHRAVANTRKNSHRVDPVTGEALIAFGSLPRVAALAFAIAFVSLTFACRNAQAAFPVWVLAALCAGGYFYFRSLRFRILSDGIEQRLFGTVKSLRWSDVTRVECGHFFAGVTFKGSSRQFLYFDLFLEGLGHVFDSAMVHLPDHVRVAPSAADQFRERWRISPDTMQSTCGRLLELTAFPEDGDIEPRHRAYLHGFHFAAQMFEEKGSFTPFEARWLPEGRIQLRPADERSSDFVSVFFRLEYQEAGIPTNMVVETIKGTETFPLSTTTKPGPAPVPIGRASFSGA